MVTTQKEELQVTGQSLTAQDRSKNSVFQGEPWKKAIAEKILILRAPSIKENENNRYHHKLYFPISFLKVFLCSCGARTFYLPFIIVRRVVGYNFITFFFYKSPTCS